MVRPTAAAIYYAVLFKWPALHSSVRLRQFNELTVSQQRSYLKDAFDELEMEDRSQSIDVDSLEAALVKVWLYMGSLPRTARGAASMAARNGKSRTECQRANDAFERKAAAAAAAERETAQAAPAAEDEGDFDEDPAGYEEDIEEEEDDDDVYASASDHAEDAHASGAQRPSNKPPSTRVPASARRTESDSDEDAQDVRPPSRGGKGLKLPNMLHHSSNEDARNYAVVALKSLAAQQTKPWTYGQTQDAWKQVLHEIKMLMLSYKVPRRYDTIAAALNSLLDTFEGEATNEYARRADGTAGSGAASTADDAVRKLATQCVSFRSMAKKTASDAKEDKAQTKANEEREDEETSEHIRNKSTKPTRPPASSSPSTSVPKAVKTAIATLSKLEQTKPKTMKDSDPDGDPPLGYKRESSEGDEYEGTYLERLSIFDGDLYEEWLQEAASKDNLDDPEQHPLLLAHAVWTRWYLKLPPHVKTSMAANKMMTPAPGPGGSGGSPGGMTDLSTAMVESQKIQTEGDKLRIAAEERMNKERLASNERIEIARLQAQATQQRDFLTSMKDIIHEALAAQRGGTSE